MKTIDRANIFRFCAFCGHSLTKTGPGEPSVCVACNAVAYHGPNVLVLSFIFAENSMLLMKRGLPPYIGTWTPPGGFVEANESLEAAAVRETAEEVGIALEPARLVPHAITSLPMINQVYISFVTVLDRMQTPRATAPEALDARWFTLENYPHDAMWDPAVKFDIAEIFEQVRTGQHVLYQWTGDVVRSFGPYSRAK